MALHVEVRDQMADRKTALYQDAALIGLAGAVIAGVIGAHVAKATTKKKG